jgi:hypothetical protein
LSKPRPLSAEERVLSAKIAAHTRWSREDGREGTKAARRAFLNRFEREVDADGVLAPDERARRAESALRAHMLRLAKRSAAARRKT